MLIGFLIFKAFFFRVAVMHVLKKLCLIGIHFGGVLACEGVGLHLGRMFLCARVFDIDAAPWQSGCGAFEGYGNVTR